MNPFQIHNIDDQVFLRRIRIFRLIYSLVCLFLDTFAMDFNKSKVVLQLKGDTNLEGAKNIHIMMIITNFFTLFTTMIIYLKIEAYKRKHRDLRSIYSICTIRILTITTLTICILVTFLLVTQTSKTITRFVHLLASFLIDVLVPSLMLFRNPNIIDFVKRRVTSILK